MAGWPRRKARIDKSRLKGIPGSTSSASRFRYVHHPLRRRVEMVPATRNTVERPVRNRCPSPQAAAQSLRARTVSETIITHQSSETVSPSIASGHWPGMRHSPVPPVPFFRKSSGKSDRRPADSAGVNGPTEGRISGRAGCDFIQEFNRPSAWGADMAGSTQLASCVSRSTLRPLSRWQSHLPELGGSPVR